MIGLYKSFEIRYNTGRQICKNLANLGCGVG